MPDIMSHEMKLFFDYLRETLRRYGPEVALLQAMTDTEQMLEYEKSLTPEKRREELTNTNCPECHYWPCKCPS
jgi:hypothetical protein